MFLLKLLIICMQKPQELHTNFVTGLVVIFDVLSKPQSKIKLIANVPVTGPSWSQEKDKIKLTLRWGFYFFCLFYSSFDILRGG